VTHSSNVDTINNFLKLPAANYEPNNNKRLSIRQDSEPFPVSLAFIKSNF